MKKISWSVSRIKSFQACKLQYNLNYNKGIKSDFQSPDATKGTAIHYIAENYVQFKEKTFAEWVDLLNHHEHFGTKLDMSGVDLGDLENGFENVKTFWKDFVEESKFDRIIPEEKIEFQIDGEAFQGTVDLVLIKGDQYVVLDYKSTKSGGSGSEHSLQLSTYVMAVHSRYEPDSDLKEFVKRVKVYVYYPYTKFKKSTLENLKLVQLQFSDVDESASTLVNAIDSVHQEQDWNPTIHFGCRWCSYNGYAEYCPQSALLGALKTRGRVFTERKSAG